MDWCPNTTRARPKAAIRWAGEGSWSFYKGSQALTFSGTLSWSLSHLPLTTIGPLVSMAMATRASSSRLTPHAAVTTIFTPPLFCGNFVHELSWRTSYSTLSSCFPGKPSEPNYMHRLYYSPAICPSGYTVDCPASGGALEIAQRPGETAMICCPRLVRFRLRWAELVTDTS